ncbi:MAG: DEAD/DEAH box helicase [Ferrovibrio sp.]|uniref:DEAD/DEAH box helicase n=1 Tax=Ferrovibrio sp. TaxID=1917215 RepID=UPI002612FD61|nr:DEAD/DEAH box helicase [Ferrovibrio sp.]MCW0233267.1 DEAD/DEAH box helicase [Ferrovibrio sp.]
MSDSVGAAFAGAVPPLAEALAARGYTTLTPVQTAVLAPEHAEADLLVSAQTGSGKTVAFGLNIAPTLLQGSDGFEPFRAGGWAPPLALIIAPTRELALQVCRELDWLYEKTGARVVSCVGGMDMRSERQALNAGAHIVVGTPGRLRDHIERGALDIGALRAVVLDEADEMLDLGFREDLEFILDAAPAERRTLLFSATVAKPIAQLAKRFQKDAMRISTAAEAKQHVDIEYRALTVAPNERENAIINVLRFHDAKSAMVFCGTRMAVTHLTARLSNRGFTVVALSGELSQNERTHALQAMRDGRAQICVATDVAARGIDLPGLELVVHADLPVNAEGLLHRSGRTGRAGNKGLCVLLVPHNRRRGLQRLLQEAHIDAKWGQPPSVAEILAADRKRILSDETLQGALSEDEQAFAAKLLETHSPEQVAAAFLRLQQKNRPAPEEMLDVAVESEAPAYGRKTPRDGFASDSKGGVWFKISAGHKQNAEPRWLLPLICRVGHVTRKDVGSIKIFHTESQFEITAAVAERFIQTIEREGTGEKQITITRADGPPPETAAPPREKKAWIPEAEFRKGDFKKRDFGKPGDFKSGGGKPPWKKKARAEGQGGEGAFQPDRAPATNGSKAGWSKPKKKTS